MNMIELYIPQSTLWVTYMVWPLLEIKIDGTIVLVIVW